MSARSINAPDGMRWPSPIVAVSQEEQLPWLFGWKPYAARATDRSIVASDVPDDGNVTWRKHGVRFHLVSANLHTGDYWLCGPDGPRDGFVCIERKERDVVTSFTSERDRFGDEIERMRDFHNPLFIASCNLDVLLQRHPSREKSFIGTVGTMCARCRIPPFFHPNREVAESFAAWCLIEWWQAWLTADPVVLAWAREEERRRGVVRGQKRAQRRVA